MKSIGSQAERFQGNDRVLFGIILGVITFWLFAQTTLNIAPDMGRDLGLGASTMNTAVAITALFSGHLHRCYRRPRRPRRPCSDRADRLLSEYRRFAWATGYNVIAIPLAAGVLAHWGIVLSPAIGAVLMSASTIIVAINAQLLRRVRLTY